MLALNDVQKELLQDLREGADMLRPPDEDEVEQLEIMALVSEDDMIREEILSILSHLDDEGGMY